MGELLKRQTPQITDFNRMVLTLASKHGRDLVVMGCSYLHLALEQAIRSKMVTNLDRDELRELFHSSTAPLSTLSGQIRMAQALGLINQDTRKTCNLLRDIRNAFSHSIRDIDCDTPEIKAAIANLPDPSVPENPGPTVALPDPLELTELLPEGVTQRHLRHPVHVAFNDGEEMTLNDVIVVGDPNDRLAFYVPAATGPITNLEDKLRYTLWRNITAIAIHAIPDWVAAK